MHNRLRHACVIGWLLLICGCRSFSTATPLPTCLPPPAPAAWIMAPHAPDLTRRMLDELSPSPMPVTPD